MHTRHWCTKRKEIILSSLHGYCFNKDFFCYIASPFAVRFVTILLHTVPRMATLCNNCYATPFSRGYRWKENIKSCRFLQLLYLWVSILDFHAFFLVRLSICLYACCPFHIFCSRKNDILIDRQIKSTCMSPLPTYRCSNDSLLHTSRCYIPCLIRDHFST
jgi:hypothetical protein